MPVGGLAASVVFWLVFLTSRWQANVPLVFFRYTVRFGLPAGAAIAFARVLADGSSWPSEWEILLLRMVIWTIICGGIAFALGWVYHMAVGRRR